MAKKPATGNFYPSFAILLPQPLPGICLRQFPSRIPRPALLNSLLCEQHGPSGCAEFFTVCPAWSIGLC